jgi:hypothetical protein
MMERVMLKKKPALMDKVIGSIQEGMGSQLKWLDHIYGRAERLVKEHEGVRRYTPNIYIGKDEYLLLLPDQCLGNFCFFVMDDPEDVTWSVGERSQLQAGFSLIVWFDMRTVEDEDTRDTESVKAAILHVLNGGIWLRNGSYMIDTVFSRAENIFQGFSLDEVQNQFLMSPFCGFRFHGTMMIKDACI